MSVDREKRFSTEQALAHSWFWPPKPRCSTKIQSKNLETGILQPNFFDFDFGKNQRKQTLNSKSEKEIIDAAENKRNEEEYKIDGFLAEIQE